MTVLAAVPSAVEPVPQETAIMAVVSPPPLSGAEHPASCPHREDVLWLAHRLKVSERRVAELGRQKKHLERRLRKALRRGRGKR